MKKRAHKVLGIEMTPDKIVRADDAVGGISRETLSWAALDSDQQDKLRGFAKRALGQASGGEV